MFLNLRREIGSIWEFGKGSSSGMADFVNTVEWLIIMACVVIPIIVFWKIVLALLGLGAIGTLIGYGIYKKRKKRKLQASQTSTNAEKPQGVSNMEKYMDLFDRMSMTQKKTYIEKAKKKLQGSTNTKHKNFLNECIQKYNAEVRRGSSVSNRPSKTS